MPYFATKDNVNLYYEEQGQGKTVVLVHGWSCNRHFFKKQVSELVKNYHVVTYDLRGHGDSDRTEYGLTMKQFAKDLKDLIQHLNLSDVTLVGWSMGTHIIFEYVKQYGCQNLNKLCFIDMTPKLITDKEWQYGLYSSFSHTDNLGVLEAMCTSWNAFTKEFVPGIFAKSGSYDQEEFNWVFKEAQKNTPHVMINMWIAMAVQDYRPILSDISVPCLITYGEESCLYPPENSEYLKEEIDRAKLVPFANCGHGLHLEDPEKFNRELIDFIK